MTAAPNKHTMDVAHSIDEVLKYLPAADVRDKV